MTHEKVKFRKSKGAYRFYGQWPMTMGDVTLSTEMQHDDLKGSVREK